MGQVTIAVGGRQYSLVCGDGEEPQLERLASYVDEKVEALSATLGRISESRMLLMASLLIADELMDLKTRISEGGGQIADTGDTEQKLFRLAERLESLAFSLEPQPHSS
ncbi:MAG TPA: cell division protein ZapA [Pedomonas sp.]|uniref:cell division protein ZapA n=1 Tax=Pedomonas sp. TaxID=2976421 RepID=UPI002F417550